MNTQQRNQERIRLWELDREAAISECARINDMRIKGCHFWGTLGGAVVFETTLPEENPTPAGQEEGP